MFDRSRSSDESNPLDLIADLERQSSQFSGALRVLLRKAGVLKQAAEGVFSLPIKDAERLAAELRQQIECLSGAGSMQIPSLHSAPLLSEIVRLCEAIRTDGVPMPAEFSLSRFVEECRAFRQTLPDEASKAPATMFERNLEEALRGGLTVEKVFALVYGRELPKLTLEQYRALDGDGLRAGRKGEEELFLLGELKKAAQRAITKAPLRETAWQEALPLMRALGWEIAGAASRLRAVSSDMSMDLAPLRSVSGFNEICDFVAARIEDHKKLKKLHDRQIQAQAEPGGRLSKAKTMLRSLSISASRTQACQEPSRRLQQALQKNSEVLAFSDDQGKLFSGDEAMESCGFRFVLDDMSLRISIDRQGGDLDSNGTRMLVVNSFSEAAFRVDGGGELTGYEFDRAWLGSELFKYLQDLDTARRFFSSARDYALLRRETPASSVIEDRLRRLSEKAPAEKMLELYELWVKSRLVEQSGPGLEALVKRNTDRLRNEAGAGSLESFARPEALPFLEGVLRGLDFVERNDFVRQFNSWFGRSAYGLHWYSPGRSHGEAEVSCAVSVTGIPRGSARDVSWAMRHLARAHVLPPVKEFERPQPDSDDKLRIDSIVYQPVRMAPELLERIRPRIERLQREYFLDAQSGSSGAQNEEIRESCEMLTRLGVNISIELRG